MMEQIIIVPPPPPPPPPTHTHTASHRSAAAMLGVVDPVMNALQHHHSNSDLAATGCWVISNLATMGRYTFEYRTAIIHTHTHTHSGHV